MANNLQDNPFAALFKSEKEVENFKIDFAKNQNDISPSKTNSQDENNPSVLEQILLISNCNSKTNFKYIFMKDLPKVDSESIGIVLFERLMHPNPEENFIDNTEDSSKYKAVSNDDIIQSKVIIYLFQVYERALSFKDIYPKICELIISSVIHNIFTALEQPDIYNNQDVHEDFTKLFLDKFSTSKPFSGMISRFLFYVKNKEETNYLLPFKKIVEISCDKLKRSSLMNIDWSAIDILDAYASMPVLPTLLLMPPKVGSLGREYEHGLLGRALGISCLPKRFSASECHFFEKASSQPIQSHKSTANSIGVAQQALINRLHKVFMTLFKNSSETKTLALSWISSCLEANAGKGGVWNIQVEEIRNLPFVTDGFMVNLANVLLLLCSPFLKDVCQPDSGSYKILKVDPLYCDSMVLSGEKKIPGSYPADIRKQTMMIPAVEGGDPIEEFPCEFSFTTSCFFLSQRAFHLGVQVAYQKISKLSQELGRLSHDFQEVAGQGAEVTDMLRKRMEDRTALFLSYKAAVFHSAIADATMDFLAGTSLWITQMAFKTLDQTAPFEHKPISVSDVSTRKPGTRLGLRTHLEHVPEFVAENVVESILAVNRYSSESLSLSHEAVLRLFVEFVTCFMGSPERMNNPHFRAHLAACLESLLPKTDGSSGGFVSGVRHKMILDHPLSPLLATAVVHVFVSIEMTGQSVSFEEKFEYRRPMYEVIKYLWDVPVHRDQFKKLAAYALANMDAPDPPLFLRFVNLLINDAIFLLDEGLSYLCRIREAQVERDGGEWQNLSVDQRAERQRDERQNAMLARFHNMLGSRTTQALVTFTREMPDMFTHSVLVNRMAAMLNHFLAHLVGPKQKKLKVRDMESFEFRPSEIVTDICNIYCHLAEIERFTVAVCSDDRSFSPDLLAQACKILTKIGQHQLCQEMEAFSGTVSEVSKQNIEDQDLVALAPEDFLDPIMLHIMTDPVRLPSSGVVVDRETIARHLLSDQSDPFNRQPLTMDQVVSEDQLKSRIIDWIKQQKESKKSDE